MFLVFFITMRAPLLHAGGWTQEKGHTYLKVSGNIFQSYGSFDFQGNRFEPFADSEDEFSRFRDENLAVYFETGLTNRLTLFGSLAYKEIEQRTRIKVLPEDVVVTNDGLADLDLGARFRLTEGPHIFSVSFLVKLPYLYDEDEFFKLGNGQEDLELRGLYGTSFGKGLYAGLEAAYRWRLEEPSDEMRYLGEIGYTSPYRVYLRSKLDHNQSRGTLTQVSGFSNPLLNPNYTLTRLEITAGFALTPKWQVEYSFTKVLDGKNIADGDNHQYSLVVSF